MNSVTVLKMVEAVESDESLLYRVLKRTLDIASAIVALALFSPLLVCIAIAIKLDSPGPFFFFHQRTGKNRREQDCGVPTERRKQNLYGQQFILWKFRTMWCNAEQKFPGHYSYDFTESEFKTLTVGRPFVGGDEGQEDPRVSRVGRLLRRTSLDELPNFINVLKGEMSLVGPRPDIWQHIRYYPEKHLDKLKIKPGITCLAQIRGRGKLTFLQTNDYDMTYYEKRSLFTDLRIIFKTIKSVLLREGAY